jgi:hypothetical protein
VPDKTAVVVVQVNVVEFEAVTTGGVVFCVTVVTVEDEQPLLESVTVSV